MCFAVTSFPRANIRAETVQPGGKAVPAKVCGSVDVSVREAL